MGSSISTLVFQPPDVTYMHAKKHIIWLRTKTDAKVPAFYIDRKASITILFSHGNAEDLGMIYEWFCEFTRELQVNLLAYDYEGYGKASGTPSELACYSDIEAAYTHLTEAMGQSPENIVLYGRSLGSGPSCYLAQRLRFEGKTLGGLILQSPLLSVYRVAFNFRFTLPGDLFPNVDRIADISCPILVVHGTRDEVVPFWNGEDLFLTASKKWRAKPFWVEGAGHNNIETMLRDDGSFFDRIREFLEEWVSLYQSPSLSLSPGTAMGGEREKGRERERE
eukprot:CAMPEP_0182426532 /NCGR_PEP_ID=MMETSP1167-20130531/13024_1 /TAXON_ID=2988 /ORGANISM="Mallomonas Sp, Strain CCMP3275" /LENGTH=278 /DNA_ID=CAMNT_0024608021 /DNA_START=58 /DNA_END=891 /DNA_ORIENTATION=+